MMCVEHKGHQGDHVFRDMHTIPDDERSSWPTPKQFLRRIAMFTPEGRAIVEAEDRAIREEAAEILAEEKRGQEPKKGER